MVVSSWSFLSDAMKVLSLKETSTKIKEGLFKYLLPPNVIHNTVKTGVSVTTPVIADSSEILAMEGAIWMLQALNV